MKSKKKSSGILAKVVILLSVVLAIFVGGYFFLDKLIIPKYFDKFGINGIGDLVDVVASLYNTPNESKMIKNGYTATDLTNSISKLQKAGYKIKDDGTIEKDEMASFKGEKRLELTDREFAAVCNEFLSNGLLEDSLSNLNYLNITKLTLLDLVVTPDEETIDKETKTYTKANISFIVKVDTTNLREQIAEQMSTPIYLLKIIIPDTIYFEVNYDIDLEQDENNRTNGTIAINGRTAEKSEALINVLISFIFNSEDDMDLEKFTNELGNVAMQGIDSLGDFKFAKIGNNYGIVVNEQAGIAPDAEGEQEGAAGTEETNQTNEN